MVRSLRGRFATAETASAVIRRQILAGHRTSPVAARELLRENPAGGVEAFRMSPRRI
jgi:hypothetical protein